MVSTSKEKAVPNSKVYNVLLTRISITTMLTARIGLTSMIHAPVKGSQGPSKKTINDVGKHARAREDFIK